MTIVLAITTFNRVHNLTTLVSSFIKHSRNDVNWIILIADDGSTDGTIEYIESLIIQSIPISLIKNDRQGVHHQFNTILKELENIEFGYCLKCDDDIEFIKPGWEQLYIDAIERTGYHHLCHFDESWRSIKNLKKPVIQDELIGHCVAKDVQGAFFTLTPNVIKEVGYMDIRNFGFRGVGHIDYTMRACRAGFNDINHPFDVQNSNDYIKHQSGDYKSALDQDIQNALENDETSKKKYEIITSPSRKYIPFNLNHESLDKEKEVALLKKRIDNLEKQKLWYEKNYGHQPRWFVRMGKVLDLFLKHFK